MPKTQGSQRLTASINGASGVESADGKTVTFPSVIAAEGVYEMTGTGEAGYRNAEETRKMIPFCNGLRVMEKHPDDLHQFIGADFTDPDFPVFGVTSNAHESPIKGPNGEVRVACDITFDVVDRAGNDRTPMINGMRSGEIDEVSIQYFFEKVSESGEFAGVPYTFLETDVNPYGLGMMTDGWTAKCPSPVCAIGVSGEQDKGESNMTDDSTPPNAGGAGNATLTADVRTVLMDMCPDSIATVNGAVRKRFEAGENAVKKVAELEEMAKEFAKKEEEWDKSREELEAFRKAKTMAEKAELVKAKEALREKVGADAFDMKFPDEVEVTMADLEAEWKYQEKVTPPTPTDPEAPDAEPAPEAPAPAPGESGAAPKPFYMAASGKGVTEREGTPKVREYHDDGLIPLNK